MSFSAVVIAFKSKLSTNTWNTFGDTNAGNDGPRRMDLMFNDSNVNSIHTAFCSYQDKIMDRGKSFMSHSNASERATAILIAE